MQKAFLILVLFVSVSGCFQENANGQDSVMGGSESPSSFDGIKIDKNTIIEFDLPIEIGQLLKLLDEHSVPYKPIAMNRAPKPSNRDLIKDTDSVYFIDGGFTPNPAENRLYYAYVSDGIVIHIEAQFGYENP